MTLLRSLAALAFTHLIQRTTPKNRLQPDGSVAEFTSDSLLVSDALVNLSEFCIDCGFSKIIGGLTEIKPWYDPPLYGLLS